MQNIKVLDCTLRDGGYINNWEFGIDGIYNIVGRLKKANIDIIELGFISDDAQNDIDRTYFKNTSFASELITQINHNQVFIKQRSKFVVMAIYGTCSIDNIKDEDAKLIDGIRITFRKHEMKDALEFMKKVQNKGYNVFVQPTAISDYTVDEISELVKKVNEINPYALSIVDTYGFMEMKRLKLFFNVVDALLNKDVIIGFHAHNNYQLAFANAITLLEIRTNRTIVIDTTLYGMGKGAGNLNTELICRFLNINYNKNYDVDHLCELINIYIEGIRRKESWGYDLIYFLAAQNNCHYKYPKYLINKGNLNIVDMNNILSKVDQSQGINYQEDKIEYLYKQYLSNEINDEEYIFLLKKKLSDLDVMLLAPGRTLIDEKNKILEFIENNNPIIISVNHYYKEFDLGYIFISNSIRFGQLELNHSEVNDSEVQIIATSNISSVVIDIDYRINYSRIVDDENVLDSSGVAILSLLNNLGKRNVFLAGFDGFGQGENFYDKRISKRNIVDENDKVANAILKYDNLNIKFITTSIYDV